MKKLFFISKLLHLFLIYALTQIPTQNIRGVLMDADSKEALMDATIVLMDQNLGTIKDLQGRFLFEDLKIGRYAIKASYLGYEPVIIPELLLSAGKELVPEIMLETSVSEIDEVVIRPNVRKDRPLNSMAMVSARRFSVEEGGRYAGAIVDLNPQPVNNCW